MLVDQKYNLENFGFAEHKDWYRNQDLATLVERYVVSKSKLAESKSILKQNEKSGEKT